MTELTYTKSELVFSIVGMSTPLATLAGLIIGGGDEMATTSSPLDLGRPADRLRRRRYHDFVL